ncbi:hypothetical protein B0H63DRAFT_474971 [Podospora didyma]|uniref:Uncharacterized protein n=1 Tax=Podospora didyma TaxID=330526 RepID=A0AAE0NGR7_9PEZI|nr:hypothetical protein B0H63DRAFT_474971 [Podospora didyma]
MAPFPRLPSLFKLEPTRTLLARAEIFHRQAAPTATIVIQPGDTTTTTTTNNDPTSAQTLSGGAIAGIVIGSIAGLLLLIWIIRSCTNLGAPPVKSDHVASGAWYDGVRDEYPARHRSHSRSRSRSHSHAPSHHHHHRRSSTEVREVRPVAVVRSHSPRAPAYVYEGDRRHSRRERRSRSRSRY